MMLEGPEKKIHVVMQPFFFQNKLGEVLHLDWLASVRGRNVMA